MLPRAFSLLAGTTSASSCFDQAGLSFPIGANGPDILIQAACCAQPVLYCYASLMSATITIGKFWDLHAALSRMY